jgi:hypothetical protein
MQSYPKIPNPSKSTSSWCHSTYESLTRVQPFLVFFVCVAMKKLPQQIMTYRVKSLSLSHILTVSVSICLSYTYTHTHIFQKKSPPEKLRLNSSYYSRPPQFPYVYIFFLVVLGVGTKGLTLDKQTLYFLSHVSSSFLLFRCFFR